MFNATMMAATTPVTSVGQPGATSAPILAL